ncbi:hypothetical protein COW46_05440 [Candidatus Gracilibacteria bacterium CG17_big_fil_post_rev_8_21_14_2_50_48_13]|nr:MAG: hypothetical protein COW46_05440 [Candidatus Gracilibacteria bacterium CG17_big_fil_post_rev_8_21_14_2_50_48_13]
MEAPKPSPEHDQLFLSKLEEVLLFLKESYGSRSVEELEEEIMTKAKTDVQDLNLQKQVEFLSLLKQVLSAYKYAAEKHAHQVRESGEPYIMHPLYVAMNEIYHQKHEKGLYNESPIIAALLHDTVEDTDARFTDINAQFGERMEHLVTNLTNKPEWDEWKKKGMLTASEKSALQFINAIKDDDSLAVKFGDRMHNLETIRHKEPKKQVQKILDTLRVGLVSQAEKMEEYHFLTQLYITIKRYLTDENLELYSDDVEQAKKTRDDALEEIRAILRRHQDKIAPKTHL